MDRRYAATVVAGLVLAALGLGSWFAVSDRADHRGPRYVLWKHGILPFDSNVVYSAMVGDRQREQLVIGMTVEELALRFGRLRTRADATGYQKYYSDHFFLDQQVVWLGDSAWLVVFSNGHAHDLHLVKG